MSLSPHCVTLYSCAVSNVVDQCNCFSIPIHLQGSLVLCTRLSLLKRVHILLLKLLQ